MGRTALTIISRRLLAAASACTSGTSAETPGGGRGGRGGRGRGADAGGAVPVVTATVTQKDVPVDIEAIGNVEAYPTISVRSQVTGLLTEVRFREGDTVKQGQHLFTIDPRAIQAQLEQAEANLKRDEALLSQAEAQLARDAASAEFAQLTAERQTTLTQRGIISKDQAQQARRIGRRGRRRQSRRTGRPSTVPAHRSSLSTGRGQQRPGWR